MRPGDIRACEPGVPLETAAIGALAVERGDSFDVGTWSGSGRHHRVRASAGEVIWDG